MHAFFYLGSYATGLLLITKSISTSQTSQEGSSILMMMSTGLHSIHFSHVPRQVTHLVETSDFFRSSLTVEDAHISPGWLGLVRILHYKTARG